MWITSRRRSQAVCSSFAVTFCVLLLHSFTIVWTQQSCDNEGDVRLLYSGTVNSDRGRLEVCAEGVWGTVCTDGFDANDAKVVCRQLGIPEESLSEVVTNIYFGGGGSNTPIHLDDVACTGTEQQLVNCTYSGLGISTHDCTDHSKDVGIICRQSQDCRDGDVRLVDGANTSAIAGRVEYCVGGLWGTVCDHNVWSDGDAAVVCRQLGHSTPSPTRLERVPQLSGAALRTPIVLSGLECSSTESRLSDCHSATEIEGCSHTTDVGANCTDPRECHGNEIRIFRIDGSQTENNNEGRVNVCTGGQWGKLCFNDGLGVNFATVLCRQLGFNNTGLNATPAVIQIDGIDSRPPVYDTINCDGTEGSISECNPRLRLPFCAFGTVGVTCPVPETVPDCLEGSVQLQSGSLSDDIGRVEMCVGGRWGLVCDDGWDDNDATVVCRQLGHSGRGVATHMSTFGVTHGSMFTVNNVNCTGNESSISECPRTSAANCRLAREEEAGAICGVTPGILERCTEEHTNRTVSLVEGTAANFTAGRIGTCQRYLGQSELCNNFYNSTHYVFTTMNQAILSMELNERVAPIVRQINGEECRDLISRVVCHYFFAPCGENGLLHLPLSVCPEECLFVKSYCSPHLDTINDLLDPIGLGNVVCDASYHLQGLSPCCSGAGIEIKNITATTGVDPTVDSAASNQSTIIIAGVVVAFVVALIFVVVVAFCLHTVVVRKRKATIRSLRMDILSSPSVTGERSNVSFRKNPSDVDFGGDIKFRTNGSRRLAHAEPNPYSNKQELAAGMAGSLLTPSDRDNKMMNRISSSIIRELSSNMLIPYTRLKLMECVGQGEFGVVYKGEHTEPEGDISYKTTTVAVKTLKGFFDDSQVNKIMEESIKMKHFDHPNVLHLIGVCLDAGPAPYVVMPFMANGSLLHYLKKERNNIVLQVGGDVDEDVKLDVRKRLTVMCLQIASGMEYLAGEKFVHRDLAARNCMIDIHFVIKIADFGLSEDIYSKNYFRQSSSDRSVKLPVKWMAPESLSDGVFSEKSDVWSFGVTCWEVFSGGKTPYPGMDPLLLSQMLDTEQRLNKPLNAACPDEIYTLMMQCWAKQPDERPSFNDVVATISTYTEIIAGYLDINFNPFETASDRLGQNGGNNSSPDNDRAILALVGSCDATTNKMDTENSNSKRTNETKSKSPHSSPLLKTRKVSDSQLSSAGIEIRIESPSEDGSVANNNIKV